MVVILCTSRSPEDAFYLYRVLSKWLLFYSYRSGTISIKRIAKGLNSLKL